MAIVCKQHHVIKSIKLVTFMFFSVLYSFRICTIVPLRMIFHSARRSLPRIPDGFSVPQLERTPAIWRRLPRFGVEFLTRGATYPHEQWSAFCID